MGVPQLVAMEPPGAALVAATIRATLQGGAPRRTVSSVGAAMTRVLLGPYPEPEAASRGCSSIGRCASRQWASRSRLPDGQRAWLASTMTGPSPTAARARSVSTESSCEPRWLWAARERSGDGPRTCRGRSAAQVRLSRPLVVARAHRTLCMRISTNFEIARDRVTHVCMYNGPNVFLCSFYDMYVMCSAKNRAYKRVPPHIQKSD